MIKHELRQDEGLLLITPEGALEASDFQELARELDPYLERNGKLHGVLIHAHAFPGWQDLAALVSHLKFLRDHHKRIEKVAVVMDGGLGTLLPGIASHFVHADVRHFENTNYRGALEWLSDGAQPILLTAAEMVWLKRLENANDIEAVPAMIASNLIRLELAEPGASGRIVLTRKGANHLFHYRDRTPR